MSGLRRLLDGEATKSERELLDSCLSDRPSRRARSRTAKALSAAGLATSTAAGATTVVAKGAAIASVVLSLTATKVIVGVAAAAFVVLTTTELLAPKASVAVVPTTTRKMLVPPATPHEIINAPALTPVPLPVPDSSPLPIRRPRVAQAAASSKPSLPISSVSEPIPPPPPPKSTLSAETAALASAREALARSDTSAALSSLNAYSAAFPRGILSLEASVLRIETLLRAGNRSAAVAFAEQLLRGTRDNPYAKRLRRLLPELDHP